MKISLHTDNPEVYGIEKTELNYVGYKRPSFERFSFFFEFDIKNKDLFYIKINNDLDIDFGESKSKELIVARFWAIHYDDDFFITSQLIQPIAIFCGGTPSFKRGDLNFTIFHSPPSSDLTEVKGIIESVSKTVFKLLREEKEERKYEL